MLQQSDAATNLAPTPSPGLFHLVVVNLLEYAGSVTVCSVTSPRSAWPGHFHLAVIHWQKFCGLMDWLSDGQSPC
jgi:hypothetical protein